MLEKLHQREHTTGKTARLRPKSMGTWLAVALVVHLAPNLARADDAPPLAAPETKEKPLLLVMDINNKGSDASIVTAVNNLLPEYVGQADQHQVVSGEDVRRMMELEANKQLVGCEAESCLAEIAGAMGARYVIFGDVSPLGSQTLISMTLFDAQDVKALKRVSVTLVEVEQLPKELGLGVFDLMGVTASEEETVTLDTLRQALVAAHSSTSTPPSADEPAPEKQLAAAPLPTEALLNISATGGPPLFVLEPTFADISPALSGAFVETVASAGTNEGLQVFTVQDAKDLFTRAGQLATIGADANEGEIAQIGQAMGVRHVLAAVVSRVAGQITVQMRLIDAERSVVLSRRNVQVSEDKELFSATETATRLVLSPIFAHLKGAISVKVSEEGATISINEKKMAVTPLLSSLELPGGSHLLTIEKEGFIRHEESFRITKDSLVEFNVKLRPSPAFLDDYESKANLYRILAWSASGVTGLMVGATAAAAGGWFYFYRQVDIHNAEAAAIPNSDSDPQQRQLKQDILDKGTLAAQWSQLSSIAGFVFLAGAIAGSGSAFYCWLFGEDPDRYEEYRGLAE